MSCMAGNKEVHVIAGKQILLLAVLASIQITMAQQPNTAPRVEAAAAPRYPLVAYTSQTEGSVQVDIEVGGNGAVIRAKALNGPYELRPASEKAALAWRFQPSSQEVRTVRLTFRYVLTKSQHTGLSAVFRSPFDVEVIGEDDNTQILADPPVDFVPSKKKLP